MSATSLLLAKAREIAQEFHLGKFDDRASFTRSYYTELTLTRVEVGIFVFEDGIINLEYSNNVIKIVSIQNFAA